VCLAAHLSEFLGWTPANVKLLLPPRQSRGNSHWISLVMRKMLGAGKPRELKNRMAEFVLTAIVCLINRFMSVNTAKTNTRSANTPLDQAPFITVRCSTDWEMVNCTTGS
jgi:hypothetical protein